MAMHTLYRWFGNIKYRGKTRAKNDFQIFILSECHSLEELPDILKKYFGNINYKKGIKDFSFWGLLSGRYHFYGSPPKKNLNLIDKIKRAIIKCFFVNYGKVIGIWNLVDIISGSVGERNIFTPDEHVAEIYKYHFPDYSVKEISGHSKPSRNFLIFVLAGISRKFLCDNTSGISVFANMVSPFLLKAYKILHPNQKIYIRLHDCVSHITNDPAKLRGDIRSLIENKVIEGAESYSEYDAELLDICYKPNAVNGQVIKSMDIGVRDYLYTFIGSYKSVEDKSRLDDFSKIKEKLCQIFQSAPNYINEYIINIDNIKRERISYSRYLGYVSKSEIVIDMCRINQQEGFSFRIPEALILNRKIITNRRLVLSSDFYDASRFFVIGYDSINRLESFVKGNLEPLHPDILKNYQCNDWWIY